jgi:hypothetical protein
LRQTTEAVFNKNYQTHAQSTKGHPLSNASVKKFLNSLVVPRDAESWRLHATKIRNAWGVWAARQMPREAFVR